MRTPLFLAILTLGACTSTGGPYPSLRPRAAEAIDPRVEPARPINDRPVAAALAAQLRALVAQAHDGDAAFGPAAAQAEQLAASAGPAQKALTAAIAARKPTALAEADIDAIAGSALQTKGGIAPNDLKAIKDAAAEVAVIARGQTDRIAAIQKRLGL
jgi:hypothetical protein